MAMLVGGVAGSEAAIDTAMVELDNVVELGEDIAGRVTLGGDVTGDATASASALDDDLFVAAMSFLTFSSRSSTSA